MKLLLSVGLTLFAIVPALCWPANDNVFESDIDVKPNIQQDIFLQESMPQDELEQDVPEGYNQFDFAFSQDDGEPELPKDDADELKKQIEGGQEVELESKSTGRVLRQGCTIALQLLQNDHWLGCAGARCAGATCPGVFFEGNEWSNCWGEVFRMFHAGGNNNILSGDYVGLYYPRERNWFSMYQNYGRKLTCPGVPHHAYGFQDRGKWCHCGAEVFVVYARGKPLRAPITDQDNLAFYYPCGNSYLRFYNGGVCLSSCMLQHSGNRRPPNNVAFDKCKGDSVEITIRD